MQGFLFYGDIAKLFGVDEAIMFENFRHWITKNRADERNIFDEKAWTYNSKRYYAEYFNYWSQEQVKRIINSLRKQGVLITANHNKSAYDKTLWYSFSDQYYDAFTIGSYHPIDKVKQTNLLGDMTQPIPDINTDINTDIKEKEIVNMSSPKSSIVNKSKKYTPEKNNIKENENIKKGKSVKDILKKQESALIERLERVNYLKSLTPYQLMNPKEFKTSKHKGKLLSRIATDVYILFMNTCKQSNPEMGIVPEPLMKDVKMMNTVIKKLDGDIETLLLIANNWFTFKTAVELQHGTKIKQIHPNIPILLKYANTASSEGFLGKLTDTNTEETDVGKEWDL